MQDFKLSDLTVKELRNSGNTCTTEESKEKDIKSEVPIIAETFALESESSIRESVLFQPEFRQLLRPKQSSYTKYAKSKYPKGGGNSNRDKRNWRNEIE